jgi:hypothetical protein
MQEIRVSYILQAGIVFFVLSVSWYAIDEHLKNE